MTGAFVDQSRPCTVDTVRRARADRPLDSPVKARELINLGVPKGAAIKAAQIAAGLASDAGLCMPEIRARLREVLAAPRGFVADAVFGPLARALVPGYGLHSTHPVEASRFIPREGPAPWRQWGENLDAASIEQMVNACQLPVAVAGALMPDAHVGYGLPIGGVLAVDNAVIPYAVGVDIACRMKMTVLDLPVSALKGQIDRLIGAIETETRFGMGATFRQPNEHDVMDDPDWSCSPVTSQQKRKAWDQLGTSGSGNHFVEFGLLTLDRADAGLEPGRYVALLSHSGSRGVGAQVAAYYSKVAMDAHPELPKHLKHLAWLDLDSHAGQEYWQAMHLMGRYAAANHAVIHRRITKHLGADVLLDVENHHNFAWEAEREERSAISHQSEEVSQAPRAVERSPADSRPPVAKSFERRIIIHRKGATPAGRGVLGIIPGSMASPGYLVRGRGNAASLDSASHGAGRAMSRTAARNRCSWSEAKRLLRERDVHLISAGLDEVPFAYKDIDEVMARQTDLVEVIARFDPRIVKMAPDGERAED